MIDLHTHSNYSDGIFEPAKIVENAVQDGLSAVALCDHDCIWGLGEAKRKAEELKIDFIPGVELTVNVEGDKDKADEIHMLGLFVEPTAHLEDIHARIKEGKDNFAFELAAAMRKNLGLEVYVEDMRRHFHGMISMGAFGEYMVRHGLIEKFTDRKKLTNQMIAEGKLAKQPKFGITAEEAIEAIHGAGGFAILAHPYRTKLDDKVLFERIKEYKDMGLDGLECYYMNYKDNKAENIKKSLEMAYTLGLLVSGGTDYHNDKKKDRFQGEPAISDNVLADLKKARVIRNAVYQKGLASSYGRVRE